MQRDEAQRLLGVAPGTPLTEIERAFRRRARAAHPDHGGDPQAFRELVTAKAVLTAGAHFARGRNDGRGAARPVRSRLVVRHSPARRLLRAVRARLPHSRPPRVH